jgi:hypothetical protein
VHATGATAFKLGKFKKTNSPVPEYLRIYWAWSPKGDVWTAPDGERLAFASAPALYKLYIVRQVADVNEPTDKDPGLEFLRQFLPVLEKSLVASPPVK